MSRRPKREATAAKYHREHVARLIAPFVVGADTCCGGPWRVQCGTCGGYGMINGYSNDVRDCPELNCFEGAIDAWQVALDGGHFDVHAAREYGERLVAEGKRRVLERDVFADWTRTKGAGPEDFDQRDYSDNPWLDTDRGRFGGWPGRLAREWGTVRCEACEGRGRFERLERVADAGGFTLPDGSVSRSYTARRTVERCKPCKGRGSVKHPTRPRSAPNGGAHLIRSGRRLLAALEGQPSECQRCHGDGHTALTVGLFGSRTPIPCKGCRGTGHNLSGTLPPVEYSAASRRWGRDGAEAAGAHGRERAAITTTLYEAGREHGWTYLAPHRRPAPGTAATQYENESGEDWTTATRVVPRGQHRLAPMSEPDQERGMSQSRMLWVRAWGGYGSHVMAWQFMRTVPRWRRGELQHGLQRRERTAVRHGSTTDERQGLDYSDLREVVERARPVAPQDQGPRVFET